ncbi:peptidylprolyl isomerase [Litoribrevibacter albus]|uniref:Chaperone SurA n=1 Tax=Litoribrevibacter albus TaxID=1473156 RepID=A0AA37SDR7_9GAMM|nr:peptidylprolyl isomerase [Litoribrevibacter albus]GLQ33391.1 chaperone SurA [Litoribrevibacter albus]
MITKLFHTSSRRLNTKGLARKFPSLMFSAALLGSSLLISEPSFATKQPLDRVAAQINNDIIMESEVKERIDIVKMQFMDSGRPLPPEHVLTQQVMDQLIVEELQLQMAQRAGIRISDQELNQSVANIAKKSGMTLEQFKAALESEGTNYSSARAQIKREMIVSRIRQNLVNRRIKITDQEVAAFLASEEGKEKIAPEFQIAHITVPLSASASPDAIASTRQKAREIIKFWRQTDNYFEKVTARFPDYRAGTIDWAKIQNIPSLFAEVITDMKKGELSDVIKSDIGFHVLKLVDKRGGDDFIIDKTHVRHILIKPNLIRDSSQAKQIADDLYQQLMDGADFAAMARTHTDDTGSAVNGGDLGWMSGEELVPSFARTMHNTDINEISKPFESQFGWHILQVLERKKENMASQYQKAIAKNFLRKRKFQDELENWLQELKDEAYIDLKL